MSWELRPRAFALDILWWIMDWKSMYHSIYEWTTSAIAMYCFEILTRISIWWFKYHTCPHWSKFKPGHHNVVIYSVIHMCSDCHTTLQVEFRKSMVRLHTDFSRMDSRSPKGLCIREEAADERYNNNLTDVLWEQEICSDCLSWSVMVQIYSRGQNNLFCF